MRKTTHGVRRVGWHGVSEALSSLSRLISIALPRGRGMAAFLQGCAAMTGEDTCVQLTNDDAQISKM